MNRATHRKSFEGRLRRKYGLSVEAFAWLWHAQNGCCALCEKPLDLDRPTQCNVDHEHGPKRKKTKPKVRGLLHNFCNYKVLGPIERGGATRYRNAGRYLGWCYDVRATEAFDRETVQKLSDSFLDLVRRAAT